MDVDTWRDSASINMYKESYTSRIEKIYLFFKQIVVKEKMHFKIDR